MQEPHVHPVGSAAVDIGDTSGAAAGVVPPAGLPVVSTGSDGIVAGWGTLNSVLGLPA